MKSTWIGLLIGLFALVSCGENSDENEKELPDNFTLSGTISGASNQSLYVEALSGDGVIKVAEGKTDAQGNFEFKGNVPGLGIYQLRLGEGQSQVIPLTLMPGDHLKMQCNATEFSLKPNVRGTEWAQVMNQYMAYYADFLKAQQQLTAMQGKLSEEQMNAGYLEIRKEMDMFSIEFMKKDPDNPFNIILSAAATPMTGFETWDPANLEVLRTVSNAYNKRFVNSPMAETLASQVEQIQSAYQQFKGGGTQGAGKMAPDISMKSPSGKLLKLSALKGKVVLIDFWASWCGPCRKENPNVVKLYKKYKNKGFEIFSVSLDDDPQAWQQAIEADGLTWPNHVSDLLGWKTPLVQQYGFNGIPHTVLLNKNGEIAATGLRGEQLEQKLKELLVN
jgi:thiol-disulfide isomerase/thioredoxin